MQYITLKSLHLVICVVVFCGIRAPFFFLLFLHAPVSVYHSKQATEISLWIPVYGLPPHMFAVSLRRSRAGNERLLLGRETQAFYLPPAAAHLSLSSLLSVVRYSPACFPTMALLENMMPVYPVEGVVGFWSNSGVFLFG